MTSLLSWQIISPNALVDGQAHLRYTAQMHHVSDAIGPANSS